MFVRWSNCSAWPRWGSGGSIARPLLCSASSSVLPHIPPSAPLPPTPPASLPSSLRRGKRHSPSPPANPPVSTPPSSPSFPPSSFPSSSSLYLASPTPPVPCRSLGLRRGSSSSCSRVSLFASSTCTCTPAPYHACPVRRRRRRRRRQQRLDTKTTAVPGNCMRILTDPTLPLALYNHFKLRLSTHCILRLLASAAFLTSHVLPSWNHQFAVTGVRDSSPNTTSSLLRC